VAELVVAAIEARLEGVYHVGGEPISKYELVRSIAALLRPDLAVVPVEHGAIDRTLDSSRFFAAIGRVRPSLADSLAALKSCDVSLRR
jgi:dTDP-4-dehydrorhamnose reductase